MTYSHLLNIPFLSVHVVLNYINLLQNLSLKKSSHFENNLLKESGHLGLDTNPISERNRNTNPAKQFTRMKMAFTNAEQKLRATVSDIPFAPPLNESDQYIIAMDSIQAFELAQIYNFKQCFVCNECRLEMKLRADNVCHSCFVDKNKIKMFSFENKMDQGLLPVELKNLISRLAPIMHIHLYVETWKVDV